MCEQKVSIIIPAFNAEKTIRATILSVLSQTYKNIELIVINDGSQDNTIAITSQIWDPRLQIFSFENAGANIARNRGLSMAKGEYVSFIDADDLWSPRKIECQVMALQQSVDADVAYSWTDYIDQSGNFICSGIQSKFSGNVYKRLFISNFIENGSNILVRRHSLVKIGGFSESLEGAQDWDCCLRLARQYSFVFVPEIHVFYRQSSHSMSSNLVRQEQQCLLVINQFLHDTPDILKPVENLSLSNLYLYLTIKALSFPLTRIKGRLALRFLTIAITTYPNLWNQKRRLINILAIKALLTFICPSLYIWIKKRAQKTTPIECPEESRD